jgi:hypothetical protein
MAGHDPALDLVEISQEPGGRHDVAPGEEKADEAGADGPSAHDDRGDGADIEPHCAPEG